MIFNNFGVGGGPDRSKIGGGVSKSRFLRSAIKVFGFFDILINGFEDFLSKF